MIITIWNRDHRENG